MSEFVKKTLMGYKEIAGGHSDPECTHVIMTLNEYNKMVDESVRLRCENQKIQTEAFSCIDRVQQEADRRAQKAENDAQAMIVAKENELAAERAENAHQRRLNENLLRISRERANAERKLRPKKEHTGYVVVLSSEKEYKYKDGRWDWKTDILWETVLQSPYSVDFAEEQARVQIQELFYANNGELGLIERIGINEICNEKYEDMIEDREWQDWQRYNILLSWKLRANYKAGYWEAVLTHTKPLGIVPTDMRI
jgi:hypothetical protein